MLEVSRDYQNPSPLLTFAYLGSLNRVIFDGSYFSSRRASLDIRFHVIREFFPRGDCSNVHTATGNGVCTLCTEGSVFETIPLSEDDVFSLVLSLVLSLVRFGEEKFEEQTRGGNSSREGEVPRTAWAASRSFRRESLVVKVAVHSRGRKDSPRESPCVFLRLSW